MASMETTTNAQAPPYWPTAYSTFPGSGTAECSAPAPLDPTTTPPPYPKQGLGEPAEVSLRTSSPRIKTQPVLKRTHNSPDSPTDNMDVSTPFFSYAAAQYPWNGNSSDSEFYSLSSPDAPSPACSADFSLPPSPQTWAPGPGARTAPSGPPQASVSPSSGEEGAAHACVGKRRGRKAKNPSKQRQSASEKEKLRMRDLTKALHHLRTFLPPSVAPAGQTLTKIETLRLAIRYIAHLSAQLGLGKQAPPQGKETDSASTSRVGEPAGYCPTPGFWGHPAPEQGQSTGEYERPPVSECPSQNPRAQHHRFSNTLEVSLQDELHNTSLDSLLQSPPCTELPQSYQMCSRDLSAQIVPQDFWV